MHGRMRGLLIAAILVVSACSGTGAPGAGTSATDPDAAWRTAPLVDTRTGDTFTVNDLSGKLVAIEPMAVWCTNCRFQQSEAASALVELADPDIVYISIGVDPNERPEDLADYAAFWSYDWTFVVADQDVAGSLADAFGPQILSPPSTPLILVDRDGDVVDVHFGIRGATELIELFAAHLA